MRSCMRLFLVLSVMMAIRSSVLSQTKNDSLFVAGVSKSITTHYLNLLNKEAPVYNGKMYRPYIKLDDNGHPFFYSSEYEKGTISYDGYTYKDLNIRYDLVRQQLILQNYDKKTSLIVIPDHVDSFSLHHHTFINIKADAGRKGIASGYYDLLYKGHIALLAKRGKEMTETTTSSRIERKVLQQNRYYLWMDSVYTLIKNKKDLTAKLKSAQKQNQEYIKTNKLNFRRNKEEAILSLVKFYDSIKQ